MVELIVILVLAILVAGIVLLPSPWAGLPALAMLGMALWDGRRR